MEEDSDTRSSFPSPFKQDVANDSAGASNTDTLSFRKCLHMETNVPFLQDGKFLLRLALFVYYHTIGRDFVFNSIYIDQHMLALACYVMTP